MSAGPDAGDFVSLNSWSHPGVIYQAAGAAEVVAGGPGEWPRLRDALKFWHDRQGGADLDNPHPQGAAVGAFHYDGSFRFAFYPEIQVSEGGPNPRMTDLWRARRAKWDAAAGTPRAGAWETNLPPAAFARIVEAAQEYIRSGDIYQVNLARRFEASFRGNPYRLFERLMERSPAPGAAFLDTGSTQVLSASPELFLQIEGRRIVTRPIKGTRPRDRDPVRDQQLAYELITDPKEQAELVMITDLERNDLGSVCEYGSVAVTELLRLERHPQVFHLVSTVEGELRADVDPVAAVAACFPGGSITGAPKRRAMELIAELEPVPRGLYTGAIGYFGFNGDAAFNIAIRTLVHEEGRLHFHAGSGITADSDPARECEETEHKARGLRLALDAYLQAAPLPARVE